MTSKEKNSDYDNYDFSSDFEIRDERESGRFYLDDELIDDMGSIIGGDAVAVYAAIVRHGRRSNQSARPGLKRIAKKLDYSKQHVINQIKTLESQNMVHVIRRKVQSGQNLTNIYVLKNRKVWGGSPQHGQGVVHSMDKGSPQHGLEPKESNQKKKNDKSLVQESIKNAGFKVLPLPENRDPLIELWERTMKSITPFIADILKEWGEKYSIEEITYAITTASEKGIANHKYVQAILEGEASKEAKAKAYTPRPEFKYDSIVLDD